MSDTTQTQQGNTESHRLPRAWIPWLIQLALLFVVLFVPFGFDHPSSFGLDYDNFLQIAAVFLGLSLVTAVIAFIGGRWRLLAADVLIVAAGVAVTFRV